MILKRLNIEREAGSEIEIAALMAAGFKPLEDAGERSPVNTPGDVTDTQEEATEEPEKAIDDMTVAELRALADVRGITGAKSLGKADLIQLLKG